MRGRSAGRHVRSRHMVAKVCHRVAKGSVVGVRPQGSMWDVGGAQCLSVRSIDGIVWSTEACVNQSASASLGESLGVDRLSPSVNVAYRGQDPCNERYAQVVHALLCSFASGEAWGEEWGAETERRINRRP